MSNLHTQRRPGRHETGLVLIQNQTSGSAPLCARFVESPSFSFAFFIAERRASCFFCHSSFY
ncbi:hypothetical protein ACWF82_30900 [Nocardia sp. NPDC055053]